MPRSPARRLLASILAAALALAPAPGRALPPLCDPPGDGITRALTAAYTHDVSTTVQATGIGALAGSPTPAKPVRFTLAKAAAVSSAGTITNIAQSAVYRATGSTADTLTGVTFESGTDQDFTAGDWIGFAGSARYIVDINARLRTSTARGFVSVLDAGTVVGDGIADDGPAIQAVLDANPSRRVVFPRTATTAGGVSYYSSVPLVVNSPSQALVGESAGYQDGTIIKFAKHVTGIDIRHLGTRALVQDLILQGQEHYSQSFAFEGVLPAGFTTPRAAMSNIVRTANTCTLTWVYTPGFSLPAGLPLKVTATSDPAFNGTFTATSVTATTVTYTQSGADGSSSGGYVGPANWDLADAVAPTSDGVRVGGNLSRLINVVVKDFGRHGFNLSNRDCDGGQGLSDNCSLTDCYALNCRGYGLYTQGGDANSGSFYNFNASINALGGVYEGSFLGNNYYSPKTDENHVDIIWSGLAIGAPGWARPATQTLASISRAGNLVTLTFAAPYTVTDPTSAVNPSLEPGCGIRVSGMADTSFNGTFCVVSVSGAVVTYAQAGPNASPSVSGAAAGRSLMADAWTSANVPATAGAYRTDPVSPNSTVWVNPYAEGGQNPAVDVNSFASWFNTQNKILGFGVYGNGAGIDYSVGAPILFGDVGGTQGFYGGVPSVKTAIDADVVSSEWHGKTADQRTVRRRRSFNNVDYLWTEYEGPASKELWKVTPAFPGALRVQYVDWASGNVSFGAGVATGSGATASRPTLGLAAGMQWYDTTLGLPLWWSGTQWRDAAGTIR